MKFEIIELKKILRFLSKGLCYINIIINAKDKINVERYKLKKGKREMNCDNSLANKQIYDNNSAKLKFK